MALSERVKGVALTYVFMFLRNGVAILIIPFVIAKVGISYYGVFSLVASIIGYLLVIELGLSSTSVRFLSKYLEEGDKNKESIFLGKIISLYFVITLVSMMAAFVFYLFIDSVFSSSFAYEELLLLKSLYVVLAVNIAITLLTNSLTGIIISRERFGFLKTLDIFSFLVRTALVLIFLSCDFGVFAIVLIDTLVNLTCGLAKFFYVSRYIDIRIKFWWDGFLLKEIMVYGFFISLNVVVNQINWRVDSFILGAVADSSSVAIYNIGLQFVLAYISVAAAITNVFLPRFVSLVEKGVGSDLLTEHLIKIGKYQFVMLGFFIVSYAALGYQFILLLFGEGFYLSFLSSIIVMVPFTLVLIQGAAGCILQAMNLHKVKSIILLVFAFFNIIISIYLAKKYGVVGVAIGTAVSLVLGDIVVMGFYLHRYVGLNMILFYKKNISVLFVIAFVLISFYWVRPFVDGWISFVAVCISINLVYAFLVWFFVFNSKDKKYLSSIICAIYHRYFKSV